MSTIGKLTQIKPSDGLAMKLGPMNQIQWTEHFADNCLYFSHWGQAIANRERYRSPLSPKRTLEVTWKTKGPDGKPKVMSRPWNEQDEINFRADEQRRAALKVTADSLKGSLWTFARNSISDEVWDEMTLEKEKVDKWRKVKDTYSLVEHAESCANALAKLGVTAMLTEWQSFKQGDLSMVTFSKEFKRKIEQLEACGEVIPESRKTAIFKEAVDQSHYSTQLQILYQVQEGEEGYPTLDTVVNRLIAHDKTKPRKVNKPSTSSSGGLAAFHTSTKKVNNLSQCCYAYLQQDMKDSWKRTPPCDNCGNNDRPLREKRDCPYEKALQLLRAQGAPQTMLQERERRHRSMREGEQGERPPRQLRAHWSGVQEAQGLAQTRQVGLASSRPT
jgi:hypothetical protein